MAGDLVRLNLCLSPADAERVRRVSRYHRVLPGQWARALVAKEAESQLRALQSSGALSEYEQGELFTGAQKRARGRK